MGFGVKNNKAKILEEFEKKAEKALTTVGIEWQANSSILCPVVTGRLAASINYATFEGEGQPNQSYLNDEVYINQEPEDYTPRARPKRHTVVVGTNVEYAERIEEGGAHFLRRGLQEHSSQYKKILKEELK